MRLSQRTLWVCLLRSSLKVCHVRFQAALILTPSLDFKGFEAIVLDGKVISAPVIQSHIAGGSGIITGRFSVQEATDLALLLRAGALPLADIPNLSSNLVSLTVEDSLAMQFVQAPVVFSALRELFLDVFR